MNCTSWMWHACQEWKVIRQILRWTFCMYNVGNVFVGLSVFPWFAVSRVACSKTWALKLHDIYTYYIHIAAGPMCPSPPLKLSGCYRSNAFPKLSGCYRSHVFNSADCHRSHACSQNSAVIPLPCMDNYKLCLKRSILMCSSKQNFDQKARTAILSQHTARSKSWRSEGPPGSTWRSAGIYPTGLHDASKMHSAAGVKKHH